MTDAPFSAPSAASPTDPRIRVIGRLPLSLTAEERVEFERRSAQLAAVTRQQDQVISYSCNADIEVAGTYLFDEIWPSFQVFAAHLQTAHFNDWWAWVEPKLDGSLEIDYVAVTALERMP